MGRLLPRFKSVILDMDGLVLDSEPTYRVAWQRAAEDLGFELSHAFCDSICGYSFDQIEGQLTQAFGDTFSLDAFRDLSARYWWKYVETHGIATKPGYEELREALLANQISYCLATNSQRKNAEACLVLGGIRQDFEILVTRDQVENGKPAPDLYLKAAKALKRLPRNCLAVEDSAIGIEAALSAHTIPVLITDSKTLSGECLTLQCHRFASLSELAGLLSKSLIHA